MTMMGELPIIEGSLSIKGSVGYVPQQTWVFSGSVKQNIVFGQAFEEDRYDKVMRACCLEQVRIKMVLVLSRLFRCLLLIN